MIPRRLGDVPRRGAQLFGERTAFVLGDRALSYRELDRWSEGVAAQLRASGLAGRHGAVYAGNTLEYPAAYFAIAKAGGVVVPLSTATPPERLGSEIVDCDVRYVLTNPRHAERIAGCLDRLPDAPPLGVLDARQPRAGLRLNRARQALHARSPHAAQAYEPQDAAVLLVTSGTGGRAKRVVMSHENLLADASAFLQVAGLRAMDRSLIVLPFTAAGTNTTELLAYLLTGLTSVLYDTPTFLLGDFCRLVGEAAATVVNVTPFVLNQMLSRSREVAPRLASLRKVFFASAPVSAGRIAALHSAFPGVEFSYGYGLTEAGPRCAQCVAPWTLAKPGSSGRALPGVELRVVDQGGIPLPAGALGEIAVRGPNVMAGYYRRPEETAAVLVSGWLRTGDLGVVDEDGFLFVQGRLKNVIIVRGCNVAPEEVEEALLEHAAVEAAFVAGEPDELQGERVVAYVVRAPGTAVAEVELRSHVAARLEGFKTPSRVIFVPELKRNPHHKLVRQAPSPA